MFKPSMSDHSASQQTHATLVTFSTVEVTGSLIINRSNKIYKLIYSPLQSQGQTASKQITESKQNLFSKFYMSSDDIQSFGVGR